MTVANLSLFGGICQKEVVFSESVNLFDYQFKHILKKRMKCNSSVVRFIDH